MVTGEQLRTPRRRGRPAFEKGDERLSPVECVVRARQICDLKGDDDRPVAAAKNARSEGPLPLGLAKAKREDVRAGVMKAYSMAGSCVAQTISP